MIRGILGEQQILKTSSKPDSHPAVGQVKTKQDPRNSVQLVRTEGPQNLALRSSTASAARLCLGPARQRCSAQRAAPARVELPTSREDNHIETRRHRAGTGPHGCHCLTQRTSEHRCPQSVHGEHHGDQPCCYPPAGSAAVLIIFAGKNQ